MPSKIVLTGLLEDEGKAREGTTYRRRCLDQRQSDLPLALTILPVDHSVRRYRIDDRRASQAIEAEEDGRKDTTDSGGNCGDERAVGAEVAVRPIAVGDQDRAWLWDHRLLHALGLTPASSQAGHRLGLPTLTQTDSASLGAGPHAGAHGQPLRMDLLVTQPTLHGSLPLQGYDHPTVPVGVPSPYSW